MIFPNQVDRNDCLNEKNIDVEYQVYDYNFRWVDRRHRKCLMKHLIF